MLFLILFPKFWNNERNDEMYTSGSAKYHAPLALFDILVLMLCSILQCIIDPVVIMQVYKNWY